MQLEIEIKNKLIYHNLKYRPQLALFEKKVYFLHIDEKEDSIL